MLLTVLEMRYWLDEAARLGIHQRRRIAELVILTLRDTLIAISSESRVFHPTASNTIREALSGSTLFFSKILPWWADG